MPDRSGQQLGNYRLIRLLGKGGFAEVYLGEHIYLKIPVAVKILHTQLEGGDMAGFLYAHEEKLVHRDIKPENMLIGRRSEILLSDFGIATVANRTTTQNTQMIAGTAVYMAPELFRGKPYGNYPIKITSGNAIGAKPVTVPSTEQKVDPWKFGRKETIVTLIGSAICVILSTAFGALNVYNSQPTGLIITLCRLIAFVVIIPELLTTIFGPLVGLFTGGVGTILGFIIADNISNTHEEQLLYFSSYQSLYHH